MYVRSLVQVKRFQALLSSWMHVPWILLAMLTMIATMTHLTSFDVAGTDVMLHSLQGDLASGASSEYNSGYNTDEEGSQSAYLLDSRQTSSQMDQHPLLDSAREGNDMPNMNNTKRLTLHE